MRQAIRAYVVGFDDDDIAAAVYDELDGLRVEDLLERSGPRAHGYSEPADETWPMIEEVLRPHVDRIAQYQGWGMDQEARRYCLATLDGIYRFGQESRSEFKKWAPDGAAEAFAWVSDEWKDGTKDRANRRQMEAELAPRFPKWA